MSKILDISGRGCCGCGGDSGSEASLQKKTFDAAIDTLPLTSAESTTMLFYDVINMNGDIDLTGQLPDNMPIGANIRIRKVSGSGKILWNDSDGVSVYDHINKNTEFIRLYWDGMNWCV